LEEINNELKNQFPSIFKKIEIDKDAKEASLIYKGKSNLEPILSCVFKNLYDKFDYKKVSLKSKYFSTVKKHPLIAQPELLFAKFTYADDYVEFVGLIEHVDRIVNFIKTGKDDIKPNRDSSESRSRFDENSSEGKFELMFSHLKWYQIELLSKLNIIWMLTEMYEDLSADLSESKETGMFTLAFWSSSEEVVQSAKQAMQNALNSMVQNEIEFVKEFKEEFVASEIDRLKLNAVLERFESGSNKLVIHSMNNEDFLACKAIFDSI
jgi:hypothetical protein